MTTHVYTVVPVDADSWTAGVKSPTSYHTTLESAMDALPDFVKADLTGMERKCYGAQVRNYSYATIEKHELVDAESSELTDADKGGIVGEIHEWLRKNTKEDWIQMAVLAQLQSYGLGLQRGIRTWGK